MDKHLYAICNEIAVEEFDGVIDDAEALSQLIYALVDRLTELEERLEKLENKGGK